jgi:hypothetical protein
MTKTLVLYVFHILNERVQKFINDAIFKDDNVDFIIICNDKDISFSCPEYVKTFYRDNIGYDFGGWSDALLTNDLYKNYDNFICVNSSVSGPFIPSYYKGRWTDVYINGLNNDVKLFGSTINTCYQPDIKSHVQSYIFAMDKTTLEYLIQCDIFSQTNYANTFIDAVIEKEILMSRKIIENGWNIGCLLPCYQNVDFTFKNKKFWEYGIENMDDLMYPCHRNVKWNDYQLVFIKGNRIK